MPVTRADELDARPADNAKELLARLSYFLEVLESARRQDCKTISVWSGDVDVVTEALAALRLSARQQASVEGVAKSLWLAGFKRAFDREPSDPWENQGEAVRHPHMNAARALLAKYDIFEKVEG